MVRGRALRLDMDDFGSLRLPCVLHWDLNPFVVLAAFRRGKAVIHDPARGRVVMDLAEVSKHFTGVALELAPDAGFEPRDGRQPLIRPAYCSRNEPQNWAVSGSRK